MNKWMLAAAILSLITTGAHVIAGGPEIHDALLAADIPIILKTNISIIWHATTAILLVNSLALFAAAFVETARRPVAWLVTAQYLAYAGLFVFYGLGNLGTPFETPQWIVFAAISALVVIGSKDRAAKIISPAVA